MKHNLQLHSNFSLSISCQQRYSILICQNNGFFDINGKIKMIARRKISGKLSPIGSMTWP